jgi:hypothetical protein
MLVKFSRRLLGVVFSACGSRHDAWCSRCRHRRWSRQCSLFSLTALARQGPAHHATPAWTILISRFRPSKLTPTADKVRRPYTSRYRSHTDCHRWPPLRSMLRSSRSVCSAHAPEPQISQTDATDRHQALQPPPVGPLYAYAIPGIGGQRTDVDLEQALTPHGASPRVSTTASAGGSRARLLCPRYGLPLPPQHADDWIEIERGCGGMERESAWNWG